MAAGRPTSYKEDYNEQAYKLCLLGAIMRSRLRSKNSVGIFRHIGYTVQELRNHLESKFTDGMTWDNYGKVWHIDHIKPDCLFKYTSVNDKEFKEAWALNNLQPLFAIDNLKKGKKYAG